jgi:hypothetical protein
MMMMMTIEVRNHMISDLEFSVRRNREHRYTVSVIAQMRTEDTDQFALGVFVDAGKLEGTPVIASARASAMCSAQATTECGGFRGPSWFLPRPRNGPGGLHYQQLRF